MVETRNQRRLREQQSQQIEEQNSLRSEILELKKMMVDHYDALRFTNREATPISISESPFVTTQHGKLSSYASFIPTMPIKQPDPPDNKLSFTSKSSRNKLFPLKYSYDEIDERMTNGLCIFCEEADIPGHQLKHKKLRIVMIECEDELVDDNEPEIGFILEAMETNVSAQEITSSCANDMTTTEAIQGEESSPKSESRPNHLIKALPSPEVFISDLEQVRNYRLQPYNSLSLVEFQMGYGIDSFCVTHDSLRDGSDDKQTTSLSTIDGVFMIGKGFFEFSLCNRVWKPGEISAEQIHGGCLEVFHGTERHMISGFNELVAGSKRKICEDVNWVRAKSILSKRPHDPGIISKQNWSSEHAELVWWRFLQKLFTLNHAREYDFKICEQEGGSSEKDIVIRGVHNIISDTGQVINYLLRKRFKGSITDLSNEEVATCDHMCGGLCLCVKLPSGVKDLLILFPAHVMRSKNEGRFKVKLISIREIFKRLSHVLISSLERMLNNTLPSHIGFLRFMNDVISYDDGAFMIENPLFILPWRNLIWEPGGNSVGLIHRDMLEKYDQRDKVLSRKKIKAEIAEINKNIKVLQFSATCPGWITNLIWQQERDVVDINQKENWLIMVYWSNLFSESHRKVKHKWRSKQLQALGASDSRTNHSHKLQGLVMRRTLTTWNTSVHRGIYLWHHLHHVDKRRMIKLNKWRKLRAKGKRDVHVSLLFEDIQKISWFNEFEGYVFSISNDMEYMNLIMGYSWLSILEETWVNCKRPMTMAEKRPFTKTDAKTPRTEMASSSLVSKVLKFTMEQFHNVFIIISSNGILQSPRPPELSCFKEGEDSSAIEFGSLTVAERNEYKHIFEDKDFLKDGVLLQGLWSIKPFGLISIIISVKFYKLLWFIRFGKDKQYL